MFNPHVLFCAAFVLSISSPRAIGGYGGGSKSHVPLPLPALPHTRSVYASSISSTRAWQSWHL